MPHSIAIPAGYCFATASRPHASRGRGPGRLAGVWLAACIVLGLEATPVIAAIGDVAPVLRSTTGSAGSAAAIRSNAGSKADPALLALHDEYQAYLRTSETQARGASGFTSRNRLARIAAGFVAIDTAAEGAPETLAADLKALGLKDAAVFGRVVSGRFPLAAIPALENLSSLRFARPAYAITLAGAATSQGDAAMRADVARNTFAVNGAGVTVGVLSDSFDCLGGAAAGVASGDLPAGINVLEEGPCGADVIDEARALAEIVHDIAPRAAIAVHTAFNGEASFAQGIIDLADAGARVITDDVLVLHEPMFQDGIVARAVDQVRARGISYFSAAGNQGRLSYEFPFRPSGQFFDFGFGRKEAHDFDPDPQAVDFCQQITVPAGQSVTVVFQWDQPFFSVSGPPGSQSDLDIAIFPDEACGGNASSVSTTNNVGRDPVELIAVENPGSTDVVGGLAIVRRTGPDPTLMKTVFFAGPEFTIDTFDTRSGTSYGHSAALGGLGVGAADYQDTPAFGQSPPLIEDFSSAGGTPILFDGAGNRLASPDVRQQPDITAPDGTDTTFFGGTDPDNTGFPNFFGTSASAPHVAGIAALMTERNPSVSPDTLYAALKSTAIDMDDPETPEFDTGFDFGTGNGLVQADAAIGLVPPRVELVPAAPATTCRQSTGCGVRVNCVLAASAGTLCRNRVGIFVRASILRRDRDTAERATRQRLIQFATARASIQPGQTRNFRLRLTATGRQIVRQRNPRRFRARLRITSMGGAFVSNTPITVRIR